ncbi:MAG: BNR-4 repeat-containing protein [Deltaproteobacteria bacterium]|nr:BNR-4 repeat-containing protein [Deltaproteobacteria bacterium]
MSVGSDQRVVFDDRGDAYTIFPTNRWGGSVWEVLLLHWLHDQDRWEVHALPSDLSYALLEHYDAYNDKSRPPVILANSYYNDGDAIVGHELFLIVPTRNSDGTLTLPAPVLLTDDAIHTYPGNGGSNLVITRGRYSYIVWAASQAVMSSGKSRVNGTPTYIIRYDHETRGLSEPVFLGLGGTAIDDHNTPAITIDRDGYLHVILGAHHQSFLYTKSLRPHSIDRGGWSTPSRIGGTTPGPEDPECISDTCDGYTYVSLIADQQNNLHLAARWAGSIGPVYSDGSTSHYSAQLVYLRKKSGEDWERRRSLVIPHHPTYSHWYQRIDSDRTGRLFLYYSYYADRLYSEEVEAYQAKWPEEAPLRYHANQSSTSCAANSPCYTTGPTSMYTMPLSERCECSYYRSVKEHDPVLLISDDGGDSWRIAVTNDFLIPDPLPSVGGRTVIPAGSIQRASKVPKEPRLKNLPRSKRGQKSGGP